MNREKPFSALYYIKKNKGRASICIFMMFLASMMFLAGNYIHSVFYSFYQEFEYSDKLVQVDLQSTDQEFKDYATFVQRVKDDDKLDYVQSSCYGFPAMQHGSVFNLEIGGWSYVFNSVADMEKVFRHLGIEGDFSKCQNNSIVISRDFAKNKGIKLGDKIDQAFDSALNRPYTVDALIDGSSYCSFYIYEDNDNLGRCYIFSDSMEGKQLYDYVSDLAGDLKVKVEDSERDVVGPKFSIFYIIFYMIDILIAIVLAITVNSVITGQYLKRTYEFGVYRALGMSKGEIKKKVASEILTINLIACVAGFVVTLLFTYMINELYYKPQGLHLLYYSATGLVGFIVCDALILIPLIISKGIKMSRADVTEF